LVRRSAKPSIFAGQTAESKPFGLRVLLSVKSALSKH
jgi:hypothetical protein